MRATRDPMLWSIAGLALISLGTPLSWLSGYDLATQFEDDAFYYFQIAHNLTHGAGFTFDGLHQTNGFHPLWLGLLAPLFALFGGIDPPLRAAGLLESVLIAVAAALVYASARTRASRTEAALAGLLLFALPLERSILRVGLESALSIALLAAVFFAYARRARAAAVSLRSHWLLGCLCALAALARLEAACAVLVLVWLEREHWRARSPSLLALIAPTTIALAMYAAWNRAQFGVWLPVSGLVKRAWASTADATSAAMLAAVSCGIIWIVARHRRLRPHALPLLTCVVMLGLDLAALHHLERWYLGPLLLCAAPLLATLLSRQEAWLRGALALCVLSALARIPATLQTVHSTRFQAHRRGEAADYLRHQLPPHSRVGAWNGGMLGYYSGQHVVILDGLANSAAFYRRAVLGRDLGGYLADERITYLVTASCQLDATSWRALSNDPRSHLERDYMLRGPTNPAGCDDAFALWQRR